MKNFTQKFIGLLALVFIMSITTTNGQSCYEDLTYFQGVYQTCLQDMGGVSNQLIEAEFWRNYYETEYNSAFADLNAANQQIYSLQNQLNNPITQADLDAAIASYQISLDSMQSIIESSSFTVNIGPHFPEGWSMFGYSCQDSTDAIQVFSSISDKIDIVKDEWGLSYIPAWEFNAMGSLKFSEGYQIKMTEEVSEFYFCEVSYYKIAGCTDTVAENYNPEATSDDGSCDYIYGCTILDAYNYNPIANSDDGSCIDAVYGCTSFSSSNYNPIANTSDNSCLGCTNQNAENYIYNSADIDDGSCQFSGCTDINAANYNIDAISDNGTCVSNCDETISLVVDRSYGSYVWFLGNVSNSLSSGNVIYSSNGTSYVISNVENETFGTRVLFDTDVSGIFSDGEICQTNILGCD
jgi:hypothetical protein